MTPHRSQPSGLNNWRKWLSITVSRRKPNIWANRYKARLCTRNCLKQSGQRGQFVRKKDIILPIAFIINPLSSKKKVMFSAGVSWNSNTNIIYFLPAHFLPSIFARVAFYNQNFKKLLNVCNSK